jgi:ferredoxin
MAKRKIIKIDEKKCTGCGLCIPNCPEGALQIIDDKARLISDLFCDGLGACIGTCPEGAITVEERDAAPYDEKKVMENIVPQGHNVIVAHLEHLKSHGAQQYYKEALEFLKEKGIAVPLKAQEKPHAHAGCPGMRMVDFSHEDKPAAQEAIGERTSSLRQWPVQLHLVSPLAPYYQDKDVLIAADCVAYAYGDFHERFLKNKSLAIACPKLDTNKEIYGDKITALADEARVNTLTVVMMEVPCCAGLLAIVRQGLARAKRKVPLKAVIVGIKGNVISEEWVS